MKATKLNDQLLSQLLENDPDFSLINHYGLTENEVKLIVLEWYTNGMFGDILQNDEGQDLDELVEVNF